METTQKHSDEFLIESFTEAVMDIDALGIFTEADLKRVLWLGASGRFYLSQGVGNDIDAEITRRNMIANGYCGVCYSPYEECECESAHE